MKRRVIAVLAAAVAVAGLILIAVPAAAQDGRGDVESNDWNFPLPTHRPAVAPGPARSPTYRPASRREQERLWSCAIRVEQQLGLDLRIRRHAARLPPVPAVGGGRGPSSGDRRSPLSSTATRRRH